MEKMGEGRREEGNREGRSEGGKEGGRERGREGEGGREGRRDQRVKVVIERECKVMEEVMPHSMSKLVGNGVKLVLVFSGRPSKVNAVMHLWVSQTHRACIKVVGALATQLSRPCHTLKPGNVPRLGTYFPLLGMRLQL